MSSWGPDENRAVEGIAALLEIFPRMPGEDNDALAVRMVQWGVLQGPNVRWEALLYATQAMIAALAPGVHFVSLAELGLQALNEFNAAQARGER